MANDAPESAATTPPSIVRGRFVGREVGIEITHFGQPSLEQRLPDGLEKLSAINVADGWHWTVAREGEDLVILLVDNTGVVVDDVTMRDRGDGVVIVGECPGSFVGVGPARGCDGAKEVAVAIGWERRGRALVEQASETCSCDLVNL